MGYSSARLTDDRSISAEASSEKKAPDGAKAPPAPS